MNEVRSLGQYLFFVTHFSFCDSFLVLSLISRFITHFFDNGVYFVRM